MQNMLLSKTLQHLTDSDYIFTTVPRYLKTMIIAWFTYKTVIFFPRRKCYCRYCFRCHSLITEILIGSYFFLFFFVYLSKFIFYLCFFGVSLSCLAMHHWLWPMPDRKVFKKVTIFAQKKIISQNVFPIGWISFVIDLEFRLKCIKNSSKVVLVSCVVFLAVTAL